MDRLTNINGASLRAIRKPIEDALADLGAQLGVQFKTGSGSYGGSNGHLKLEISLVKADGTVSTKESTDYLMLGAAYGLKREWLSKEFTHAGERYRIAGLRPKASKRPVLLERLRDGRNVTAQSDMVIRIMEVQEDSAIGAGAV